MSHQTRDVATLVMVCDLCNAPITRDQQTDSGSLGKEYGRPAVVPAAKHVWLIWPGSDRRRRKGFEALKKDNELLDRRYDFHGECILRVVEAAVVTEATP